MFKTAALAALVLLDDLKPKPESRAEKYITDRVPMLSVVADDFEPVIPKNPRVVKSRKPRKRHVCEYGRSDIWATFVFGAILGAFALHVLTHI
jgi:hypothetical protein